MNAAAPAVDQRLKNSQNVSPIPDPPVRRRGPSAGVHRKNSQSSGESISHRIRPRNLRVVGLSQAVMKRMAQGVT
jgi:hypothetical protein